MNENDRIKQGSGADIGQDALFTMPPGADFLPQLAKTLKDKLGDDLSTAMIFLPTRRAVRGLADAFLAQSDARAALLPTLKTLADFDVNEPPFEPGDLALDILPAIDETQRRFALSQLVAAKLGKDAAGDVDAAAALAMTDPLLSILNDLQSEELPLDAVSKLSDRLDLLPEHQQDAVAFIEIISTYWPQFLADNGLIDPMQRRVAMLRAASQKWQDSPPTHPVIVAGSTGTLKATAEFIKTIAGLPKGMVVLPGLDLILDSAVWDKIDDQHPQSALKRLLAILGVDRDQVKFWPGAAAQRRQRSRERVLAESLIPVESTADWPSRIARVEQDISDKGGISTALDGLSLIEARTGEEEAAIIALIVRQVLDKPAKSCAIVTPDPALARRVRAKLSRFGIEADSSAGEPLEETPHGAFLSQIVALALDPFNPLVLNDLYTHTLFARPVGGLGAWQQFDAQALRGPRASSYAQLNARMESDTSADPVKSIHEKLAPLSQWAATAQSPTDWARALTQCAEALANGPAHIWFGEAGEKSAAMLEELIQYGGYLPDVDLGGFGKLLSTLMRGRVVRPRYGTQTRLQILGPLEARMISADMIVLAGLNEGVWPAHPPPHPLLSRGMRKTIGLHAPERRFGQSAHDFAALANHDRVILTRAQRSDDGPQVMSRWLWRLVTLVKGALRDEAKAVLAPPQPYLQWARRLDAVPENPALATRPAPRPDVDKRWQKQGRRLSVTQIQTWIRDPYSIYAQHVLGLSGLELADLPLAGREFGTAIHKGLEDSVNAGRPSADKILAYLTHALKAAGYADYQFARLQPMLMETAAWTSNWIAQRRGAGWALAGAEPYGKIQINPGKGHEDFTLSGKADVIERRDGAASIIDFKTGGYSNKNVIKAGFDPQLPLLAFMSAQGAFGPSLPAHALSYVRPNKQDIPLTLKGDDVTDLTHDALKDLKALIVRFDQKETPYYSQPRIQYTNDFGDFDHLARRTEWAALGDNDGNAGA